MACDLNGNVTLEFLSSGITVVPLSVDMRRRRKDISQAICDVTEEDGKRIANQAITAEPVELRFGEYSANRFFFPDEDSTLEFTRSLDDITKAELTLPDASYVLKRGTLSKNFNRTSLNDALTYIMDNRDDPEGVLNDNVHYHLLDENLRQEREVFAVGLGFGEIGQPLIDAQVGLLEAIQDNSGINFNEDTLFTGFHFKDMSPYEAIQRVMEEFELNWRVEPTGQLIIGAVGSYGRTHHTTANEDNYKLSRYNVTSTANLTSTVHAMSVFSVTEAQDNDWVPDAGDLAEAVSGYSFADTVTQSVLNDRIQAHAEATLTGIDGKTVSLQAKKQQSPAELERTTERALLNQLIDDSGGSFAINGSASSNFEGLAALDVGDWFMVDPSVEGKCDIDVLTGSFVVDSVQHRISGSRGWKTTVNVSQIPSPTGIETRTWFYDPSTDQTFDSIKAYNEFKQDN